MIDLAQIEGWIRQLKLIYDDQKMYLSELDSAIGDGDHGINMARGFTSVVDVWEEKLPTDPALALKLVSSSLVKSIGGASGPLYGTFFLRLSIPFTGKASIALADFTSGVDKGVQGIAQMGNALMGDKTMLDVWLPALDSLKISSEKNESIKSALDAAVLAAKAGMEATIKMVAKKGRASYLGDRSVGHQDPGATSTYLMLQAAAKFLG